LSWEGAPRRRALLVDFGGVLTTNVFDSFRDFCTNEGLPPDAVKRLFRSDPEAVALLRQLERGELAEDEFSPRFARMLGVKDHQGMVDRLFAGMRPDDEMSAAVRRARDAGIRTVLVSNSWSTDHYDRALLAELFDEIVISAEVGLHKPERAIFELAAERAGVPPAECVLVDDLRENCAGAEAVGMAAVLHRGAEGTIRELERLFDGL
jgi:epoxide hydrolase-like predicted phosphatase